MALSEDLPLYRDTYRLLNNLLLLSREFPRFFRYSMGSRMVDLPPSLYDNSYFQRGLFRQFIVNPN